MSYRLVHLELYVVLVAEQLIGARRGELFTRVGQEQEVVEEESPEILVALCFVHLRQNKPDTYKSHLQSKTIKQHLQDLETNIYRTFLLLYIISFLYFIAL